MNSSMSVECPVPFVPLDKEIRITVETDAAAFHLNRKPQTLRAWACKETGPIRPLRINGRLAWPVLELRHLLGCRDSGRAEQGHPRQPRGTSTTVSKGAQA